MINGSSKEEKILNLKIVGMDNPHCVSTISGGLDNLKGVISKRLSVNEKAEISYDPSLTSDKKIKKIIKKYK